MKQSRQKFRFWPRPIAIDPNEFRIRDAGLLDTCDRVWLAVASRRNVHSMFFLISYTLLKG